MSSKPSPQTDKGSSDQSPQSLRHKILDNLSTVAMAVLLAVGVRTFIAEPRYIPSSSMEPTLQIDDRVIIDKISLFWQRPDRGQIVVFHPPESPVVQDTSKVYIKRIIGLPGENIAIRNGKVFINGQPLTETYTAGPIKYELPTNDPQAMICPPNCFQPRDLVVTNNIPSFTVPPNHFWVMGDNRNNSADSHTWGFLPADRLVGRALFRYWPLHRIGGF